MAPDNIGKLKLFISYCHSDEKDIIEFRKHIAPLKTNGLIEDWYDRKILSGTDYQKAIDNNLDDADIICLFISSNFLSSNACMVEKSKAMSLRNTKNVVVIPIILASCGWLDDFDLKDLLALPTDGSPISKYSRLDEAWNIVYEGVKTAAIAQNNIYDLEFSDGFDAFLNNVELLTKAHSKKAQVLLSDIYIWPTLSKFDESREFENRINSKEVVRNVTKYGKILIAGENQSGKTTLCKQMVLELRKNKFVPIYIQDDSKQYHGIMENRIEKAYSEQYKNIAFSQIDRQRIVPIVDNFHFAKDKDKHIGVLSAFKNHVIIVDDIFGLNIKDESLIAKYCHFGIEELTPKQRVELIQKWIKLDDGNSEVHNISPSSYREIDEKIALVNSTLGKMLGKGIMPSYPFFILAIINTYEAFSKPLDEEITSQGYCYQALIYMYLRKQGVKNDDVDTYVNFLTEMAYFQYANNKLEIPFDEFNSFMEGYLAKYHLPVPQDILLAKLQQSQIVFVDSFGNYRFCYQYLYYFFIAKYLAEHLEEKKEAIGEIIGNLHKDENAYIAIFVSHHSRSDGILDDIILNAYCLFDKYSPATLDNAELGFFDKQADIIVKAVLPSPSETPEEERAKRLDEETEREKELAQESSVSDAEDDLDIVRELRRSIKTVEVIGHIVKNRAGSLDKQRLNDMFEEAMKVHLRILTSFCDLIRGEQGQQEIIEFISNRLEKFAADVVAKRRDEGRRITEPTKEELEKVSRTIFWNLNFLAMYGILNKIITSLGSTKLIQIIEEVCDKMNTPASFIVKHGILMWYNKNLRVDEISKRIKGDGFSSIAIRMIQFLIVNHCSMHPIGYKDKQKIEKEFNIPSRKLLECQIKK